MYDKELTVALELVGDTPLSALEVMRGVREVAGGLVACRATGGKTFEVTVTHKRGKERLLDGFRIGEVRVHGKALGNN